MIQNPDALIIIFDWFDARSGLVCFQTNCLFKIAEDSRLVVLPVPPHRTKLQYTGTFLISKRKEKNLKYHRSPSLLGSHTLACFQKIRIKNDEQLYLKLRTARFLIFQKSYFSTKFDNTTCPRTYPYPLRITTDTTYENYYS